MGKFSQALLQKKCCLGVVGLGYVGLPLAVLFAKKGLNIIGFDINHEKIDSFKSGIDPTGEFTKQELSDVQSNLFFTNDPSFLKKCNFIIVAVPTPIDSDKTPDLSPVTLATEIIAKNLNRKTIIVYESTVYPGVTEEICAPLIEKFSQLSWENEDFFIGYSPERINPGDQNHPLDQIVKIVSGQNDEICDEIGDVYQIVIKAGVHKAENIKVAEAAKVIENTQRDLNIALMNELAIIFHKIGIDTESVLKAAGTKWNFMKFHPGLVGGHCIGVDPYYLTSKAEQLGYHPQVVLAGRRINNGMGEYVAQQTIKQMIKSKKVVEGANILILGLTFKENVPDFRNSRVFDIISELKSFGTNVFVYDPFIEASTNALDVNLLPLDAAQNLDAIIVAIPHDHFRKLTPNDLMKHCKQRENGQPVLIDIRWIYNEQEAKMAGFHYWRL